jgi:hypothetical protein
MLLILLIPIRMKNPLSHMFNALSQWRRGTVPDWHFGKIKTEHTSFSNPDLLKQFWITGLKGKNLKS